MFIPVIRSNERLAASDGDSGTGSITRRRIGEHYVGRCEFGRLSGPLKRHLLSEVFDSFLGHGGGN